jgi:hypothetical protein
LRTLTARPLVLGERSTERCVRRRGTAAVERSQPARLVAVEALRVDAVHDHVVHSHAQLVRQTALEVDRLVHGHLLRQRHDEDARGVTVAQEGVDDASLAANRPDARHARIGRGRPQHRESVAGGGRVDDRQIEHRAAGAAFQLGQVPYFADRDQLAQAGGRRREVLEQAAAAKDAGQHPGLQLVSQPLLLRALGLHRYGVQPRRQLPFPVTHARNPEQRGEALLLGDLAHHGSLPLARSQHAERGGDGRPPDATLARNDHEPPVEQ